MNDQQVTRGRSATFGHSAAARTEFAEPRRRSLPTVSAVIVTYNRRHQLETTIAAVSLDDAVHEIVVVVDGCHDGSYELARALAQNDDRIRVVWQPNGGDASARQAGVEAATGDIVLMLDDDVIAAPGLASGHAERHLQTPDAVVLGYMPVWLPPKRSPGQFASYIYATEYESTCRHYEADPASILRNLWTGNMSLWRSDALRIGFVTRGWQLGYHSDQGLGLRCVREGMSGVFDRRLGALHMHARDMNAFLSQSRLRGGDRRTLCITFPDLVNADELHDRLPAVARAAVALAARPRLYGPLMATLKWHARTAGGARQWWLESFLARFMRQVELRRGYQERPLTKMVDELPAPARTHAVT